MRDGPQTRLTRPDTVGDVKSQTPELPASTETTAYAATIDDAPEILELARRVETQVTGETSYTLAEVSEPFTSESGRRDTAVITLRRDGVLVGYADISHDNAERFYADVTIDDQLPREVYDALAAACLAWAESTALSSTDGPVRVKGYADERDEPVRAALNAAGFAEARGFYEMHLDLSGAAPPTPVPDVVVRQVSTGDLGSDDVRLAHRLVTETFRDHYDFIERPFEKWVERHRDNPASDFDSWWIAEVDGEPVGVRIDNARFVESHNAAYVANLGTLRSARGRGVARSLLAHSFESARAAGRDAVKLHVDSESPTGATRLYESVGMRVNHTVHEWEKHLR